jgi:hypothetical protein
MLMQGQPSGGTGSRTERLINPMTSSQIVENKENDEPVHGVTPTPAAEALPASIKRPYIASPYKADGAPPPKRPSHAGIGNWMSPVGKRKSGSAGGYDSAFHDARKAYKVCSLSPHRENFVRWLV